jgi:hypothetical protein
MSSTTLLHTLGQLLCGPNRLLRTGRGLCTVCEGITSYNLGQSRGTYGTNWRAALRARFGVVEESVGQSWWYRHRGGWSQAAFGKIDNDNNNTFLKSSSSVLAFCFLYPS